jgi:hypothetical protein
MATVAAMGMAAWGLMTGVATVNSGLSRSSKCPAHDAASPYAGSAQLAVTCLMIAAGAPHVGHPGRRLLRQPALRRLLAPTCVTYVMHLPPVPSGWASRLRHGRPHLRVLIVQTLPAGRTRRRRAPPAAQLPGRQLRWSATISLGRRQPAGRGLLARRPHRCLGASGFAGIAGACSGSCSARWPARPLRARLGRRSAGAAAVAAYALPLQAQHRGGHCQLRWCICLAIEQRPQTEPATGSQP